MRRRRLFLVAGLLVAVAAPSPSAADEAPVTTLEVGASAPDFDLPGVDGRRYNLGSFASARVLVVVFTANHCPTAQAYEERIQKLADDYRERGVALAAISPNDPKAVRLDELGFSDMGDSFEEMALRARERGFTFPYLYDGETQAMARRYGPTATPHAFVFDEQRRLRFVGRIDDSEDPAKVTVSDTHNAIEALLSARPVPVEKTKVFGCSIKWSEKRSWVADGLRRWAEEPVTLETIDGAGLKELVKNDSDRLRLINVWATWCGPCLTEFPDLVTINRMYRNRDFDLVTVNMDAAERREGALRFLVGEQASMRNVATLKDDPYPLIEAIDPQWSGALPHTLLVAPGGRVIYRSQGSFDSLKLRRAIVGWLGRTYHSRPGAQ